MQDPRVLVLGELNVDIVLSMGDERPEEGKEKVVKGLRIALGSSSAIFAASVSRLGAKVRFLGKVGRDVFGDFILGELSRFGVSTEEIIASSECNTGVTVSLSYEKDRALLTYLGSVEALRAEEISPGLMRGADLLHVSSYFLQKGIKDDLPSIFREAKEHGLLVSFDTGWDPFGKWNGKLFYALRYADIFLPNEAEALEISSKRDVREAAIYLSSFVEMVVVKRGGKGALMASKGQIIESPSYPVEIVDTTGAGDNFNAGFIFALLKYHDLTRALKYGNACGALSTTVMGGVGGYSGEHEVISFLRRNGEKI